MLLPPPPSLHAAAPHACLPASSAAAPSFPRPPSNPLIPPPPTTRSTYINPKATGKDIIRVSRYVIVIFGVLMGVCAIILFKIGLSLGWVYLFMGIAIGSAVAPIYMALVWDKANAIGAITGAISGTLFGLMAWLVTCQAYYGELAAPRPSVPALPRLAPSPHPTSPPRPTPPRPPPAGSINIDNLGGDYPMLAGNLTSIFSSLIIITLMSLWKPQNYDWKTTREIPTVEEGAGMELPESGEWGRRRAHGQGPGSAPRLRAASL